MGVKNFLEKVFKVTGTNTETVVIPVPASIYYKELAIYTASSYLANAISMAEMRVFNKGKPVKDLVCAGQGENQDRITLHLYVQKDGTIGKTQYYKGSEEIEAVYDYSSADKEKLEEDGRKKLKELQNYKKCTMTVDDIDLELGDIVSGYDAITDTQVIKPVKQKVVKCQNGKITIDYKVEGDD